jgi:hypothetical protein
MDEKEQSIHWQSSLSYRAYDLESLQLKRKEVE